jgi:hypothetical protein
MYTLKLKPIQLTPLNHNSFQFVFNQLYAYEQHSGRLCPS